MRLRTLLATVGLAGLLSVPFAAAKSGHGDVVSSAKGNVHWTIPLPNAFGVEVVSDPLKFAARKYADGSVKGHFEYRQIAGGETFEFTVDVTCMNVYDGNRAKIGGVVTKSTDATQPPGRYAWVQVFDNGKARKWWAPDQSSLVGFGDETANEAFCNSPNLPRFGPWEVQGDIRVR
jgi:hypothetical protein